MKKSMFLAGCAVAAVAMAMVTVGPLREAAATSPAVSPATATVPATAMSAELVPLKLELPKPAYEGTPKDQPPSMVMEAPRKGPRPEILVPKGCENLAFKKKVTASDDMPLVGKESMVTDGEKRGRDGNHLEMSWGLQWVQIDLEKSQELYAIVVWHYHLDPRVYKCVVVQVSDDKDFKKGVTTVFNNDQANDSGLGVGTDKGYVESHEGKLVETKGIKARYVRLYSKGNTADDQNQVTEVEVWGLPAK